MAKGKSGKEGEASPGGRRTFFRSGLKELTDAFVGAARAVEEVVDEVRDAVETSLPSQPVQFGDRVFHKARTRGSASSAVTHALVRPPGALPEPDFLATCKRCHRCVEACPPGAIFRAGPALGPNLEQTPLLYVDQRPCVLCEDVPCAAACPSGALQPINLADLALGKAEVSVEACLNTQGDNCRECVDACPVGSAAIGFASEVVPQIRDACVGCGQCVVACRAHPKALAVIPTEAKGDAIVPGDARHQPS